MVDNLCVRLATAITAPAELIKREDGQTLVEYALILALVSIVCAGSLIALSGKLNNFLSTVVDAV